LTRRFAAGALPKRFKDTLRRDAARLAGEAADAAPGHLGATVEMRDVSRGEKIAFAVGTPHGAARFTECGTVRYGGPLRLG